MELLNALFLLLLASLTVNYFLLFFFGSRSTSISRLPPGPRPLPIVGSLFLLGDKPHHTFAGLANSYGPLISLRLGQIITVVISSPDVAKDVLQKHDQIFAARSVPDAVRALSHHELGIAWQPPSAKWRNLRRICKAELFTLEKLDSLRSLRQQKVQVLLNYVLKCSASESPVEVGRAAFTTSLNLLSTTIFSDDLADINSESSQTFKDVVVEIMGVAASPNLSDLFPILAAVDLQGRRRRLAALIKKLHDIFDEQIDRRHLQQRSQNHEEPSEERTDMLHALLKCQIQDGIDRQITRSLLTDLFAAGSDTTSSTVEWAMAELLRSPTSMAKARDELASVIGRRRGMEESDIPRLPFLQAVVKETLRLHPPVPFLLPRQAQETIELRGYTIPKGARVLVNIWAIGRDEKIWENPDKFIPERFLDKGMDFRGQDFELLPFGAGRRICPGLPLASRMVHLMLGSLLQKFDWKVDEEVDMTEVRGDTDHGCSTSSHGRAIEPRMISVWPGVTHLCYHLIVITWAEEYVIEKI